VVEILHIAGWRGAADAQASMKPEDLKDRDEVRRLAALAVLWELLAAAKKVDAVTWRRMGGPEAEAFLHALESGGQHPLLRRWEELKATVAANRPAPDPLDRRARQLTVLMVETLVRAGMGKDAALKWAAAAVKSTFPASKDAIRSWQRAYPTVTSDDEKLIAGAINRYGADHRHIAGWFVGLIRIVIDPVALTARPVRK
jgi:hypothetical protein